MMTMMMNRSCAGDERDSAIPRFRDSAIMGELAARAREASARRA